MDYNASFDLIDDPNSFKWLSAGGPALCRESGSELHELGGFSLRGGPPGSGQRRSLAGRAPACPQVTVSGPGQGAKGSRNEERKKEKKGEKGWGEGRMERKPWKVLPSTCASAEAPYACADSGSATVSMPSYPPAREGDLLPAPGP